GDLLSTTDPLGNRTSYAYDSAGNLVSTTDALGDTTTFAYDAYGDLTGVTEPLGITITYTYDANGNRLTQSTMRATPHGVETIVSSSASDGNGRPISTTDPLGHT